MEVFIRKQTKYKSTSLLISSCLHLCALAICASIFVASQRGLSIDLDGRVTDVMDFQVFSIDVALPDQEEIKSDDRSHQEDLQFEIESLSSLINQFAEVSSKDHWTFDLGDVSGLPPMRSREASGASSSEVGAFFGIPPTGDRIVYIIDRSPSMRAGKYRTRYDRAVDEVLRSVNGLHYDQEFFVIMFSFQTLPIKIGSNPDFALATGENKQLLEQRLRSTRLSPGTDPREAIVTALNLEPSCIFLLSDGEFNGRQYRNGIYRDRIDAYELSLLHNQNGCPINTIGLEDLNSQAILTRIAEASGGTYVFIPAK